MKGNSTLILLGGNSHKTKNIFSLVSEEIKQNIGSIIQESSIYESSPWGFESTHNFLNRVVEINTKLTAEDLLEKLLKIEKKYGRIRSNIKQYEDRIIDIDILLYGNLVINSPTLTIPHPRLHLRRFTLLPLCEYWPDIIHPSLNISMKELLENCKDKGKVFRKQF